MYLKNTMSIMHHISKQRYVPELVGKLKRKPLNQAKLKLHKSLLNKFSNFLYMTLNKSLITRIQKNPRKDD
jgi:hypothetical protein